MDVPKTLRIESLRVAVSNPVPAVIMFAVLLIVLVTFDTKIDDVLLDWLGVATAVTCLLRLITLAMTRWAVKLLHVSRRRVHLIEAIFAATYVLFAGALGLYGARVLALPYPEAYGLILTMLVGYAAGVAATLDLKPRIAVPSIVLATCPSAFVAVGRSEMFDVATGVVMLSFVVGGCYTILHRNLMTIDTIRQRNAFMEMAHLDDLTGLPNRVEMRRQFELALADARPGLIAAHYIDLNGFKKVNDELGHEVGDMLLKEVANRLSAAVGPHNMLARLGGDEFVVLQFRIEQESDAEELRVSLRAALLPHFDTAGADIALSASVGSAVAPRQYCDLEDLLRKADAEQYLEKKTVTLLEKMPFSMA